MKKNEDSFFNLSRSEFCAKTGVFDVWVDTNEVSIFGNEKRT